MSDALNDFDERVAARDQVGVGVAERDRPRQADAAAALHGDEHGAAGGRGARRRRRGDRLQVDEDALPGGEADAARADGEVDGGGALVLRAHAERQVQPCAS